LEMPVLVPGIVVSGVLGRLVVPVLVRVLIGIRSPVLSA
jgi:hypothetical protein